MNMQIKNWDKWQTYRKDRGTPPWIKVYRNLLSNEEWVSLTDSEKGQLVSIWMLGADKGGKISDDPATLQKMCMLDSLPNINKFISLGFLTTTCQPSGNQVVSVIDISDAPETETETETETDKKTLCQKNKFSDEDMNDAVFIFNRITLLNPKHKSPNFNTWANEIRKIRQIDGRTSKEIRGLFGWANADPFWQTNILSPKKLREKWDQLEIKKNSEAQHEKSGINNTGGRTLSAVERVERACKTGKYAELPDEKTLGSVVDEDGEVVWTPMD